MSKQLFAIRDNVAKSFNSPFADANEVNPKRSFLNLCKDKKTIVGTNAEEFSLWRLGEFNEETGEVTNNPEKLLDGKSE